MAPKKGIKMDLNTFLQDDAFGGSSWADDEVDFNTIEIPVKNKPAAAIGGAGFASTGFQGDSAFPRRDREEYPIPDAPPYRARVNNLPWDTTEELIGEWFEDYLKTVGAVINVSAPRDMNEPTRLKGFGFVTFNTREQLEQALLLNATELQGRRVFVNVAAPEKSSFGRRGGDDFDWGSARGGDFREPRPRREEPDLDWSSARGTGVPSGEPRGYKEHREPRQRREEPEFDWSSARGTGVPSGGPREYKEHREPRQRREEPEFDWSSARGTGVPSGGPREYKEHREPRPRREEPELDWSSARGSGLSSRPERKPKREEPEIDWSSARSNSGNSGRSKSKTEGDWASGRSNSGNSSRANSKISQANEEDTWSRGQKLPTRSTTSRKTTNEQPSQSNKPAVVKSSFSILAEDEE